MPILVWLLLGCPATHAPGIPQPPPGPASGSSWRFEARVQARTQAQDAQGAALEGLDGLAPQLALRGALSRTPLGLERDGSQTWALRFGDVERELAGGWTPSELSGRQVLLRGFEGGGVLALTHADTLAGAPRWGDVVDLLLAATRPAVPALRPGQSLPTRQTWPFVVGPGRGWQITLAAGWARPGVGPAVQYAGLLEGAGVDEAAGLRWRIDGRLEGELLPAEAGFGDVVWHRLQGQRRVEARAPAGGARLVQTQDLALELLPGAPVDPHPTPARLAWTEEDLLAPLRAAAPAWSACGASAPARAELVLTVQPEGHPAAVQVLGELPDAARACLEEAASALVFPSSAEDPVTLRWPLVFEAGALVPYPVLFLTRRAPGQLLLLWPEDAAVHAQLERALGR